MCDRRYFVAEQKLNSGRVWCPLTGCSHFIPSPVSGAVARGILTYNINYRPRGASNLSKGTMTFCTSCAKLQIQLPSFLSHPGADDNQRLRDPIRFLGLLSELQIRCEACSLCQLIFAIFRSAPIKHITRNNELKQVAIWAAWTNPLGAGKAERIKSTSTVIIVWPESPCIPRGKYKITIRAVSAVLSTQPHFGVVSPTQCSSLDCARIRRWLQRCEGGHSSCYVSANAKPTRYFYVVDTMKDCIVEPVEPCRYLALSYVWGGVEQHTLNEDNIEELKARNGIRPRSLAPTIRDAIALTKELGERYLWIDTLCVIQDSKPIREQTLADMNRIYAQSLLTIVAGSCTNANDELPGVTVQRTWKQWYQKISPILTLSAHFDFKDLLEDSTYCTRAWT
jgi:hypothetical protein